MRAGDGSRPALGPGWRRPHLQLLFLLRSVTADPGTKLASWRLSVVLMLLTGFYSVFLAIWAISSPPEVVRNIASLLVFWAVYLLLLVNTGVCFWRRLPALGRQLGRQPSHGGRRPDWEIPIGPELESPEIERLMRRGGYRSRPLADGSVFGLRGRLAPLGPFLFHGSFFFIAAGFLLTLGSRSEATLRVAVGEEFRGDRGQVISQSGAPRPSALDERLPTFAVAAIHPEFWRDQLLFTTLEADLVFPGGRQATTRINRPLWLGPGTFLRLAGFGYTPRYELTDGAGAVADSAFVKLNVFPPGQRDSIDFDAYPHRVFIEVLPDFAVEEGEAVTRSLNLVDPAVRVEVYRGKVHLGEAILRQGDGYGFEGLILRFPEIRYWGEFSLVRDPGAPVLFAGYLLGLFGLLLKIRGGRGEALWTPEPFGSNGRLCGWGERPAGWPDVSISKPPRPGRGGAERVEGGPG